MIALRLRITCDTHTDGEATWEGQDGLQTLKAALDAGWRVVAAPSGKSLHLCPECFTGRFGTRHLTVVPDPEPEPSWPDKWLTPDDARVVRHATPGGRA